MSAKNQKTVMSRSLARALIEAGMEHFDAGGPVPVTQAPTNVNGSDSSQGFLGNIGSFFTAQNGYQANVAPTQQSNFGGLINHSAGNVLAGYDNAGQIQGQQQALANELLDQSRGGGPNPAQAALNSNTGVNVANTGALMAGQRGAGANVGLLARQIGQTGAGIQQNAVGQEATLQAQQRLAAQQALQAQEAQMASQNLAEQGINSNLYGTSISGQNAQNANTIQNYGNAQNLNQKTAESNSDRSNKALGGILNDVGGFVAGMFSQGGPVLPDHLRKIAMIAHGDKFKRTGLVPGTPTVKGNSASNDTVNALLSPGEVVLPRSVAQAKNAPSKAAEFMRSLQQKKDQTAAKKAGYGHVAEKKRNLKEHTQKLGKKAGKK